jgi:hypothetical protein
MENILKTFLEQAKVGRVQSHRNLAVYPLLSTYLATVDYLTLDEALSQNLMEVVEVNEGGSVPELKVVNGSPAMVLILDGEELVGAKQNRIVNVTILIPPKATTVIPVSCVEQGRWSYDSRVFSSMGRMMTSELRAMKATQVHDSLRHSGSFRSDQGAIWDGIARKAGRRGAESPSMAMAAIYEKERVSVDDYVKPFRVVDGQIGAVFMINGKLSGLEAFGKPATFSRVFKKLLESYALDAIDYFDPDKVEKPNRSEVTRFLKESLSAPVEVRKAVGAGADCRFETRRLTGFALGLDDQLVHLSIFARSGQPDPGRHGSRIQRPSQRRRHRT